MRDFTEREVMGFCEFARSSTYQVRFIEFMPLDADRAWKPGSVLTGKEVRALIQRTYEIEELPAKTTPHRGYSASLMASGRLASSALFLNHSVPIATASA